MSMRCASLKKGRKWEETTPCVFGLIKVLTRQPSNCNEIQKRTGKCVLCSLTFAKHQGRYAHDQNDRHWSPQTTRHACLRASYL